MALNLIFQGFILSALNKSMPNKVKEDESTWQEKQIHLKNASNHVFCCGIHLKGKDVQSHNHQYNM